MYVLHTTTTTVYTRRFIRYLYCSAGRTLETVGKKFPGLWKWLGKVFKILEAVEMGFKNLGNFLIKFQQLWNYCHEQCFQCKMEAKNSLTTNGAVQKTRFSNQFQLLSMKKWTFWKWRNNCGFPPVFMTLGSGCNFTR